MKPKVRIGKVVLKSGYEEPGPRGRRILVWEDGLQEAQFVETSPGVWERATFLQYVRAIR